MKLKEIAVIALIVLITAALANADEGKNKALSDPLDDAINHGVDHSEMPTKQRVGLGLSSVVLFGVGAGSFGLLKVISKDLKTISKNQKTLRIGGRFLQGYLGLTGAAAIIWGARNLYKAVDGQNDDGAPVIDLTSIDTDQVLKKVAPKVQESHAQENRNSAIRLDIVQ